MLLQPGDEKMNCQSPLVEKAAEQATALSNTVLFLMSLSLTLLATSISLQANTALCNPPYSLSILWLPFVFTGGIR